MLRGVKKFLLVLLFPCLLLLAEEEDTRPLWDIPTALKTAQDYHRDLQEAVATNHWWEVIDLADLISGYFPNSPFAEDASFSIGEAFYHLGQLELANRHFSLYLSQTLSPKHFEEALQYKFTIAEQYKEGVKKPLFGSHKMPKLLSGKDDAIEIYEEITFTLPQSEMAMVSLLHKALLQAEKEDFRPAQETLDLLIRRAPKHELAVLAFLDKLSFFHQEAEMASPDPNILDLAEVALQKFRLSFPREERIAEAEREFRAIQSCFADNLLTIGKFFEKTKKYKAAELYYEKIVSQFPLTEGASEAQTRLEKLTNPSTT